MTFFRSLAAQITPAFRQMLAHVLVVFAAAFVTSLSAGLSGSVSVGTLWALTVAAGAAGVTAVAHYLLGLIPRAQAPGAVTGVLERVPPIVQRRLSQIAVSFVATFAIIAGSAALAGASSVGSPATAADLAVAAISAGVAAAVQYLTGLVPQRFNAYAPDGGNHPDAVPTA